MAKVRLQAYIDSEVALQVQRFHRERLEEAGLKVTHEKRGRRWFQPKGLYDEWSFSRSLELLLVEGLSQIRVKGAVRPRG